MAVAGIGSVPRGVLPDWVADLFLFVVAALFSAAALYDGADHGAVRAVLIADGVLGGVACLGIWVRRERPVQFAIVVGVFSVFSLGAAIVSFIAMFTVIVHRRPVVALAVTGFYAAVAPLTLLVRPEQVDLSPSQVVLGFVCLSTILIWGLYIRARRELVASLHERADRAEAEQELRIAQARQSERTLIAREMHDVLAHRLSLLSLHAGALELRPSAPPEKIASAAKVIRQSAHQVLDDLREVIGVLRVDRPDDPPERPQPGLTDLAALVEESRLAGDEITLDDTVALPARAPAAIGRAAYRIVQEGLTNARKHAPGRSVTVTVRGEPGADLTVELTNQIGHGRQSVIPGTGTGLIGLSERAAITGGRLDYGRSDGLFRLRASLPWPA